MSRSLGEHRHSPPTTSAVAGEIGNTAGIEADAGVATLMSDAGLTTGAFYAHFASKEDLVANVPADQLRTQRRSVDAESPDPDELEAFVGSYLSPEHRDQCADGCPSAALLDEILGLSGARWP